ncbi:lanthionine synthetase LanC family protein [Pedobacter sp. NJ-S-72]
MKERIQITIDKIYSSLKIRDYSQLALFDGESGCCIFDQFYIEYSGNKPDNVIRFENSFQRLSENSIGSNTPFFCSGKAGINWFFSYLNTKDILDDDDLELLCEDNSELFDQAVHNLKEGNYDFLHGAIGIAYYFLYDKTNKFTAFQENFFQLLYKFAYSSENELFIAHYDLVNKIPVLNRVNFGMAHGLPGILKFCLQCYKRNICAAEAKKLALDIAAFLKSNVKKNTKISMFPNILTLDEQSTGYSRVGWCYGDLSIGFILYQAGMAFNDLELKEFATEILIHTSKRRTEEETLVRDAGICHGSAGIAHIYNKMWHYTQNSIFKETCDFWIQKTLDFSIHQDAFAGYKAYAPTESGKHMNSFGLLNGVSGIGLVLISYLTGDFSWDYCLMLND